MSHDPRNVPHGLSRRAHCRVARRIPHEGRRLRTGLGYRSRPSGKRSRVLDRSGPGDVSGWGHGRADRRRVRGRGQPDRRPAQILAWRAPEDRPPCTPRRARLGTPATVAQGMDTTMTLQVVAGPGDPTWGGLAIRGKAGAPLLETRAHI